MPKLTKAQREEMCRQAEEAARLKHAEFQKDLPRKIIFELIPELVKRDIGYAIFYGKEIWDKEMAVRLEIGDAQFNILKIEEWQWEGEIMGIIRDFDHKQKIAQEREAKRNIAINKLTKEEREILGIE